MATILYFGWARECAGVESEVVRIEHEMDTDALWARLIQLHPGLAECRASSRMAVDMEYATGTQRVTDDSEVAIIPPVAGG